MLGIKPEIVLFGLGVGVLIGLTGIGGGSLMTPLLIVVLGVAPVTAIGTDLAYGALTKTFGGVSHLRKGTVDTSVSLWLAVGSVPGTLVGALLVNHLHRAYGADFNHVLLGCVAGALLISSSVVLARTLLLRHLDDREHASFQFTPPTKAIAVAIGLVLGTILGLTSVGSGALIGVAMILVFKLTPQRVAGSSVFLAALLLWVAGIVYVSNGQVNYSLMGNILIGSIPGVWIGSHFVDRVPTQALRVTLAVVLLGSALAMVSKAGLHLPTAVIIGLPVLAAVVGYLMRGRQSKPVSAPAIAAGGSGHLPGATLNPQTTLNAQEH